MPAGLCGYRDIEEDGVFIGELAIERDIKVGSSAVNQSRSAPAQIAVTVSATAAIPNVPGTVPPAASAIRRETA